MSSSSILELQAGLGQRTRVQRAVLAGIVGNVLEWYDFAVYGYFAGAIGKHFFPSEDPAASLIAAFGVFAAGFLMRPLGGLLFGSIGDKIGRNHALILSVLTMAVPTFLIGLLPGHDRIGTLAPVLLVVLRLLQGLAVGGEYTTSVVFLVESAPPGRRGFVGSWTPFGATAGVLLGSAAGTLISWLMSQQAIESWGWRLPFLAGVAVGFAGWAVRRHLPEPSAAGNEVAAAPIREAFRDHWRAIVHIAALNTFLAVGFYFAFVYAVTWMEDALRVPSAEAFEINTLSMIVLLMVIPCSGALSDRIGRRPVLLVASLLGVLFSWPLLWLMHHHDPRLILGGQIGFALLVGLFGGVIPVTMAEALPRRVRCTTLSVSYNLCVGILGGTTPAFATYLIERSHDDLAPAFYLMAAAAASLAATVRLPRSSRDEWEHAAPA
jgi:MFS transporter, MHS family, proline/betaine transporter